ncbi:MULTISPECIES: EamA family transporter [unclassified Bordetella]|uniref:EamA family transporter n=1 Tax=unclassified Bordetella TaxID=2630031 RepID=UPI00132AA085|nr:MULTISPECIES: EamA family transporter [unclassified Bordetella]MVW70743.1 EamA family transporter [Bordetella sp. 15P40C-2]MVW79795.1 EamA family transporter [Bordetella sp. 02P26C-1]
MPFTHLLLALTVVFIWGTNFVVIKWGLDEFPAFLFAALRFALSALPWVFLLRRPAVPWSLLIRAGLLLGVGQFGLVYWAMRHDISPGLASLVVQAQVFFTILMTMVINSERIRGLQIAALICATCGYALVAWYSATDATSAITLLGFGLVMTAAFCWACTNMTMRRAGRVNMLSFTAWSSLFSVPPLLLISLIVDGPTHIMHALTHASVTGWLSALWQGVGNTVFGFGVWGWLLARHPAATVTPMGLLVPIFGILSSAALLGEALPMWKILAAALVLGGLALNIYASRSGGKR